MTRFPTDHECDPGQAFAAEQFRRDLLRLLLSYNDLWRHRKAITAIAEGMQAIDRLHPTINSDGLRALIASLHAGARLAFSTGERLSP